MSTPLNCTKCNTTFIGGDATENRFDNVCVNQFPEFDKTTEYRESNVTFVDKTGTKNEFTNVRIEKEKHSTTPKSVKQERKTDDSCISTDESVYLRSDSEQQENNSKLFIAIRKKNKSQQEKLEKIKQLLEKNPKPNINAQDGNDNRNTSLHMAINKGYLEIVNFLLQNGAESNLENKQHKTPLMLARELNNQEIITALENHVPQARRPENTAYQQSAALPEQPIEQQSEWHEEQRGNIAEIRVSDNDPQSESSSDGKIQSILPPFSGKLAVDTPLHLKLSSSDFRQSLEKLVKRKGLSTTEQLNAVPSYPTPYVLAQFASQVYQDYNPNELDRDYEKRLGLPEGWRLLTTAVNQRTINGYFGAAYWHSERQQVVIAHRGTKLTTLGADWADIMGVVFKNYVPQMNSAATFTDKVNQALNELNKQPGVNFQLFFTGHSLGGWLSQITAFTTKYLKKQGAFFQRNTSSTNYHVHTVVFDSPGCEAMLSQMQESFDVRYSGRSISLDTLNITSYLSAPNRINTCNSHLGTVYRIFTDLSDMSRIGKHTVAYTLATHRMDKILQAFNPTTGQVHRDNQLKIQEVIDWPISTRLTGGKEWKGFFNWAQHLNDYHPDITDESFQIATASGYYPIRYQTKPFDGRSSSLNIFTYAEQQFLERYRWLRELKEFFKPEDLFSEISDSDTQKSVQEKLQNFKIENEVIRCTDAMALQEFIPFIKRLIQLFPQIQEKTKQTLSSFNVRKKVYRYETAHYLQAIQQHPLDINGDVIGLGDFLKEPQQQVWQLVVENNTRIGLIKVYRSWQRMKGNTEYQRQDSYTILKLKRLLTIHQQISLCELLNFPEMTNHLLIVECNTDKIVNPEVAKQVFKNLLNVINNKPDIKIIVITKSSDGLTKSFLKKAKTVLNNRFRLTKDIMLKWSNLTSDVQKKLLEKKVNFQGYQVALNQLIDPQQHKLINSIPLPELIDNQLVIGDRLPISTGYDEDFYIDRTFNHQIAIKRDIFHAKQQQKFSDLLASTEQEFKHLCPLNPTSNIHWLKSESGGNVIWQQSQGSLAILREYIDFHRIHSYPPENLNDFLQQAQYYKVMLISDTAGMGKTTVLTHLSKQLKQKFPTHWVIRINLNDHTDALEAQTQQRSEELSSDSAIEFISQKLLRLKTPLEQVLFKQCFKHDEKVKVALLFDGFDEISPIYKDTVINLLQILRKSSVEQLWVTTRPHMKKALEDKLQHLSCTLKPFSPENQISFLTQFWKKELTLPETSQQRLAIYAKALIEKLSKSIRDKEIMFTGIPLQTRMLADSFKEEVELSDRLAKEALELPDKLDLLGLYERFIETKYNIYQEEKTKAPVSNVAVEEQRKRTLEGLRKVHQQLALQVLFTEKQVRLLQAEDTKSICLNEEIARIGIVQIIDDRPHFIHRTFAEYFTSDFVTSELQKQHKMLKAQDYLLTQILLQNNYKVIRAFLNRHLTKNQPSQDTITEYGKYLSNLWSEGNLYEGKEGTILHKACKEGNTNIVIFLFDSLKSQKETLKNLVLATTKYGATVLHRAAESGNWELVKQLLVFVHNNVESSAPGTLKSMVLACTKYEGTVLHRAAESGNWELVKQLFVFVQDNFESSAPGTLKSLVLASTKYGETVLHRAAESDNWELVKQLFVFVQDNFESSAPGTLKSLVLATTNYGGTVLHRAAASGNWELVKQLLAFVKDNVESSGPGTLKSLVLASTKYGETVLHRASASGNWELVKQLLVFIQDNVESSAPGTLKSLVLASTKYGETVLHRAAESENWELVKRLLVFVKDNVESSGPGTLNRLVLATTGDGGTVLHQASASGNWELVKQLLVFVKYIVESSAPRTLKSMVLASTKNGETVLHRAAESGNWELVKQLLVFLQDNFKSSAPGTLKSLVLASTKYEGTVLHQAAETGNWELVKQLLVFVQDNIESSAPGTLKSLMLASTKYGGTALYQAAESRNWELVKQLLVFVKDNVESREPGTLKRLVLATNRDGGTVLQRAKASGNLELVKQLLVFVNVNFESNEPGALIILMLATTEYGETVSHQASARKKWELVKQLLAFMPDDFESSVPRTLKSLVLASTKYGETVLHRAAETGNWELVKQLLVFVQDNFESSAPGTLKSLVLASTKYGETVLHRAAETGNWELVKQLLVFVQDNFESSAPGTLKSLVLANIKYGETVLHQAAESGNWELVKQLLVFVKDNFESSAPGTLKCLVLVSTKYGGTVLHRSAKSENCELVKQLLVFLKDNVESSAPGTLKSLVLATTKYGGTVLHRAAESKNLEFVRQLLVFVKDNVESSAPGTLKSLVFTTTIHGETVLHRAATSGNWELVKQLLVFVQDNFDSSLPGTLKSMVLACTKYEGTVLHRAAESGNWELVKQLFVFVQDNFESSAPGTLKSLVLATTNYGGTVLHRAAASGNWELVKQLLVFVQDNFESSAPGTLKSLMLATTEYEGSVLHRAAESENLELVKQLLVFVKDNFESSAPGTLKSLMLASTKYKGIVLHRAAASGNWELIKQLLVSVKDNFESSAPGTLKSLVLATTKYGGTVLHRAAASGNWELVKHILDFVQDNVESSSPGTLNSFMLATSKYGETVLQRAAACGNEEFVKQLLGYVQNVNLNFKN